MQRAGFIAATLLMTLAIAGVARAEVERDGDIIVTLDGGISPRALPRTGMAPVTVTLDSTFKSAEGSDPPPQLRTIAIGINRGGRVFDRGLPTCRVRRIQPTTIKAARRICGNAVVGSGHVQVRVHLANQPPFTFKGPLLVFHAEPAGGHRRLLAQVYGRKPPSAFVLTFSVLEKQGTFGTVIKTTLPKPARQWAFVTHFDMKLHRVYTYQGQKYSFISAGCAAPEGFPGAVYPFARANFGFAENRHVVTTLIRDCTVS
ncbi:MAG TPA: hypothetical protein VIP57_02770 [Candidatus Dormibacteraeota bacterium]